MDQGATELLALERLLVEFFTKVISNDRRQEIERQLTRWQQENTSWNKCFEFLVKSNNQFVTMFCLTTLESVINKKWMALPVEDRGRLKQLLYQYSLQPQLQPSTTGKVVKLVVDTARMDWPHFYPDFFTNIMSLLRRRETAPLGLLYLLTTSQEFGCSRSDLSVARNSELQRLLLAQLPQVFAVLSDLLSTECEDCLNLQVLNHLFSWIPAEQIPPTLMTKIFSFAFDVKNIERALAAISTLNEMLYRNWTPPCWQQFIQFVAVFLLVPEDNLNRRYLRKLSDLLRLVVTFHMSGGELIEELLTRLLEFTERQITVHPGLTSCLTVWNGVLDHPTAKKYVDILVQLAELVVNRIQWSKEGELSLATDDDDDGIGKDDDVEESPWQRTLRPCLEIVARVAELRPQPILQIVVTQWVYLCQSCSTLDPSNPRSEFLLRDLASLTRTVGRLSPAWSEAGAPTVEVVKPIVSHLLSVAQLQYHSMSDPIKLELLSVHCEALAALKACCYWLTHLTETELNNVTLQLITIVVQQLQDGTPRKLQHCASHLFLTLTATIRLPDVWSSSPVRPLFEVPFTYLEQEDGYLVAGGLMNCLILPSNKTECQLRIEQATRFALRITQPLNVDGASAPAIINTLHLLSYLVRLYKSEGSKQKKLLCVTLKNAAERTLLLFQASLSDPIITQEILQFFLTLLECLQTQVGVSFIQGVVQTFLLTYSVDRVETAIVREDGGGLQQLLSILDLVIQTPALASAGLTPLAVQLCLQLTCLLPLEEVAPPVQESYYRLVYSILENKWQYLVKGASESEQRAVELSSLLRTMTLALLRTDINVFRLNLSNFEKLNQRWKLYRTAIFKKEFLAKIVAVLLETLLKKSHDLLADDIALCLCHLIFADPEAFFTVHLPDFLSSVDRVDALQCQSLLSNFSKDMDLPSLTKNIFRLINDLACYQICNVGQDPRALTH